MCKQRDTLQGESDQPLRLIAFFVFTGERSFGRVVHNPPVPSSGVRAVTYQAQFFICFRKTACIYPMEKVRLKLIVGESG